MGLPGHESLGAVANATLIRLPHHVVFDLLLVLAAVLSDIAGDSYVGETTLLLEVLLGLLVRGSPLHDAVNV